MLDVLVASYVVGAAATAAVLIGCGYPDPDDVECSWLGQCLTMLLMVVVWPYFWYEILSPDS
jgi:hypothetical protein